MAKIIDVEHLE